jgi:hypothetical protein
MFRRILLAGVAVLVAASAARAAQNLADVARAEEARRSTMKAPVKVYTNDDLRGADGGDPPAPPPSQPEPAASNTAKAPPPKPTPDPARDEKYWRDRISGARVQVQRSQALIEALQSQINGLYTEFVNMSDPIQRAVIEQKRLAAMAEQDRLKADVATQIKVVAAIEDEARRASVPAGWLR